MCILHPAKGMHRVLGRNLGLRSTSVTSGARKRWLIVTEIAVKVVEAVFLVFLLHARNVNGTIDVRSYRVSTHIIQSTGVLTTIHCTPAIGSAAALSCNAAPRSRSEKLREREVKETWPLCQASDQRKWQSRKLTCPLLIQKICRHGSSIER